MMMDMQALEKAKAIEEHDIQIKIQTIKPIIKMLKSLKFSCGGSPVPCYSNCASCKLAGTTASRKDIEKIVNDLTYEIYKLEKGEK